MDQNTKFSANFPRNFRRKGADFPFSAATYKVAETEKSAAPAETENPETGSNQRKAELRAPIRAALRLMPALSHWPDKPSPWCPERSEVLLHIISLLPSLYPSAAAWSPSAKLKEAALIFGSASKVPNSSPVVRFHPRSGLWQGIDVE